MMEALYYDVQQGSYVQKYVHLACHKYMIILYGTVICSSESLSHLKFTRHYNLDVDLVLFQSHITFSGLFYN